MDLINFLCKNTTAITNDFIFPPTFSLLNKNTCGSDGRHDMWPSLQFHDWEFWGISVSWNLIVRPLKLIVIACRITCSLSLNFVWLSVTQSSILAAYTICWYPNLDFCPFSSVIRYDMIRYTPTICTNTFISLHSLHMIRYDMAIKTLTVTLSQLN